jgi:decaprenylphospho-beta-D-erythro-pentofuranosid-2-ulose 2-reductase
LSAPAAPEPGTTAGRPEAAAGAMTVAVLGATSAIAEQVARRYAAQGARLFLAGRRPEALAGMARDLEIRGAAAVSTHACDLASLAAQGELLAALGTAVGVPDLALIAWGTLTDQARAEADAAYAAAELERNFVAPAALLLPLAAAMQAEGRGVLAVISSVAGDRGRKSNFVYGSAKGGLQRFLEGLRHRLAGRGVVVLDIRPGFVDTPMTAHLARGGPLWATPDQVAQDIVRAVERRRAVLYTPWFWRWIMLIVRSLPRAVLHRTGL